MSKYHPLNVSIFEQNRQRFMEAMVPNSLAVFTSNPQIAENGDALYAYKANSDLVWLTGITQEKTMLVIYPDNQNGQGKCILFIQHPNELLEKWNGHLLRKDEAKAISGIDDIYYIEEFDAMFKVWMHHVDYCYLNTNENDRLDPGSLRTDLDFIRTVKAAYPLHQYLRAARLMKSLRAVKTPAEIEVIKEAVRITDKAFRRVLGFLKPGVHEFEIEAEITHEFLRNRATRHAYHPIIASGGNACILHYVDNNQECKDGDLLLMDFGAEYGNYNADLSRTIPVNGKYTPRQKEVYNACLNVHRFCASILKPGINYADYIDQVNAFMNEELIKLGLYTAEEAANVPAGEEPLYRRYFYHGIGHHIGLDVHDVGTRNQQIEEGMYFTIEPGIYIAEENMGVRIENNYWITKDGNIDLYGEIPITVEEIEQAMSK